jgi:ribitol 2-dehydrogenase
LSQSLQGKSALITGASSGIGRALAVNLDKQGCRLALTARSIERLEQVRASLTGKDVVLIPADLAIGSQVDAMTARALDHFGGALDVFLANAGLYVKGDAADGDPDAWDQTIAVNVNSVFRACRAVLPSMIERRSGDVIVTSSIAGHIAIPWEPIYSATKHAVQSFVHGVRRQVAKHNVRVGAVAPGMVLNELWGISNQDEIRARAERHEGLLSEDVAEAVVFMLTRPPNVTIRDLVMLPQNQDL